MGDWIDIEEAQEISGYHPEYLRQLMRQGHVSGEKKGGQWWIDRQSLTRYLKEAKKSDDKRRGPKSES